MKKFTKIVLILSAVFIVLGMALMIGTGILGDLYYGNMKLDSVGIDLYEASEFVEHGEDWMEHELRAMFGENADSQTGRIAGNEIRELDLSVKAARVKIVRDDKIDGISILNSSKQLDVKHSIEEDTLHLEIAKKDESKSVGSFDGTEVKLMIPSHMSFDDLEIDLSAGELTAEQLSAEEMSLNLNAASAVLQEVSAGTLDVNNNASALVLDGAVSQNLEVDCNAGNVELLLDGAFEEFQYDVDCKVGSVLVDDREYSGLKSAVELKNDGAKKHMELDCKAGEIDVQFEK